MSTTISDLRALSVTTQASTQLPFIENGWYAIAFGREIQHALVERTVLDRRIVLYRTQAGEVVAVDGLCPHRQYPLMLGALVGDAIECGYHGLQFDCDGACIRIPGQDRIPPALRVHRYPTVERGGWVWAWLGDPERADEAQINEIWLGDPEWKAVGGSYDVQARSQLILENLMDLSHESFIHSTSIGNIQVAETPVQTEVVGDIVRGRRSMKGVPAAPSHAQWGAISPVDREQLVEFFPPSFIVVHGQVCDARQQTRRWKTLHAITPITKFSSRYQFALIRDFEASDAGQNAPSGRPTVIEEDIAALEAQEKALTSGRALPELSVEADAAALQMRRILRRLSREPIAGSDV